MSKGNKALSFYLETFGTPSGRLVLKDLLSAYDCSLRSKDQVEQFIHIGQRRVIDHIKDQLRAASGNSETYAGILYESEVAEFPRIDI